MNARQPAGTKPTVPLLLDGDEVLPTSVDIARHADHVGGGSLLFPPAEREAIVRFTEVSDQLLDIGRCALLGGLRNNREAQREGLPALVPAALRGVLAPLTVTGAMFIAFKHDVPRDPAAMASRMRPLLDEVRAARGDRTYLLSGFTFADVAVASALQAVRPYADGRLGPGTRAVWSNEAIAADYENLLAWRDALYEKHRHPNG